MHVAYLYILLLFSGPTPEELIEIQRIEAEKQVFFCIV